MSRIVWDKIGERYYETGVKNCVLYVKEGDGYGTGVAWNGITAVTETPSGAEASPLYADDIKYLNLISNEEFGGSIEAYTYPDEFKQCNGESELDAELPGVIVGQQRRKSFGLCYRTTVGNDVDGNDHGYKLHFVYNAQAAVSERAYATVNDSPEAITFSWEFTTTPVEMPGSLKPAACITIDSTKLNAETKANLAKLEDYAYGTGSDSTTGTDPKMPTPEEIASLLKTGQLPAAG